MRAAGRLLWLLVLVVLLVTLLMARLPQGRTAIKTLLFIPQVVPTFPVQPQEWFLPEPVHQEIRFPMADSTGSADIYRPPDDGRHSAVLLFFGVAPAPRDDPRVVELSQALARAGMVVMTLWSERMMEKRLDAEAPNYLVTAFQYLRSLPYVDPERVGVGGFCVGASLVTIAAADPRIADEVRFVNSFGGYFNAKDLVRAIASRQRFYDTSTEPWHPDDLTSEVFTGHLLESLRDPQERTQVETLLEQEIPPPAQLEVLSPQGKAVYGLIRGVPLEETELYIAQLPEGLQRLLEELSPSQYVEKLKARVLIMHDREDALVPSTESRRLADALTRRGNLHYTEFTLFKHMDPTRPLGLFSFAKETFKLFWHMYNVLRIAA